MSTVQFIRRFLELMHGAYDEALGDLTPEQLHWRAGEHGLPIAFFLWHYVRTEDNLVQLVLRQRQTLWLDGGWAERLGMDPKAQGGGMSLEQAQRVRIASKEGFLQYMQGVWRATHDYLVGLDDTALNQLVLVKPLGQMRIEDALGMACLSHGFTHLGDILHLRGLQGLTGPLTHLGNAQFRRLVQAQPEPS